MSKEVLDDSQEGVTEDSPSPRERVEAGDDGFVIDAFDGSDEADDPESQEDEGEPDNDEPEEEPEGDEPKAEDEPEDEPEFDGLNGPDEAEEESGKKTPNSIPYGVFSDRIAKKNEKIAALEARLNNQAPPVAPQQAYQAPPIPQAAPAEKVPVESDFDNHEDYVIAKAGYEGRQAVRDEQAKVIVEQQRNAQAARDAELKAEVQTLQANYDTKVELAIAKNPKAFEGYTDMEDAFRASGVSPVCVRAVMESSTPAPIVKYLAKNPTEASRIAKLSDVQQALEIGKLEQRASMKPQKNKVSQAPKPIKKPKAGGGDTSTQKFEDDMPQGKFQELRSKAIKEKLTPAQMLKMK